MRFKTKLPKEKAAYNWTLVPICALALSCPALAQEQSPANQTNSTAAAAAPAAAPEDWNFHLQNTDIGQGDLPFPAKYSGPNSLDNKGEVEETVTLDLFAGKRLWSGGELHADGLMWQGFGLSETTGIEAFPNNDAYKFGTQNPRFMFSRLFIRQTFGLGGKQEAIPDDQLSLASMQDISRITLTVGRFSPTDVSDTNAYAGDPHAQFMNWALVANNTWDYGSDSVGFAPGFTAELNQPNWTLRYGCFMMPKFANGFTGDDQFLMTPPSSIGFGPFLKDWAMNAELERRYSINNHPGAIRFQTWLNEANMFDYQTATALLKTDGPDADLSTVSSFRHKYGFGLNWEQEVAKNVGVFSRLGWNDGQEQAWTYTDVNSSGSLGVSVKGDAWHRPGDSFGLAGIVSGASSANQDFLKAGGLGILAGDGVLNYGPEEVLETYYNRQLVKNIHGTLDYQFVNNPAFNQDRGPVSIFGVRLHYEF